MYRLDGDQALVATLDFFTPLVDDPADFGAIAAANALSDLYAMRARPILALNILAVPVGTLPPEVVGAILGGAAEICREAGIAIAGGHSIDDAEPKYGLVALGLADPERLWRKAGARPGDAILLGKGLGTGVVTTGIKRGVADPAHVAAAVASMRRLNREAADALSGLGIRAATDVTGYGLLGHLREVCDASGVSARIRAGAPYPLPGALDLAAAGCVPGGTSRNRKAVEPRVRWEGDIPEPLRLLLYDPQTSGGLLAAVPSAHAAAARAALEAAGYAATLIGEFEAAPAGGPVIAVEP